MPLPQFKLPEDDILKLGEIKNSQIRPYNLEAATGILTKVRVVPLTKGEKESKRTTLLFYGPLHRLTMDPKWFRWSDGSHLQDYTAKKGRSFLRSRTPGRDLAEQKWSGYLPPRYVFRWDALWNKTRAQKESTLIWQIWHQGVAINKWRKLICSEFDGHCNFCVPQVEESTLHRFWECPQARRLWEWAWSILNKMRTRRGHTGPWEAFHWKQVILEEELPQKLKRFKSIWSLLKGTCMWTIWIHRNALVFDHQLWSDRQVEEKAWASMVDYGQSAWQRTVKLIAKQPEMEQQFLSQFDKAWLSRQVFGSRTGYSVKWRAQSPRRGLIIQPATVP